MVFDYSWSVADDRLSLLLALVIMVFYLCIFAVYFLAIASAILMRIASYVLQALGFQTIARRRGIKNPWLAWIPFANTWQVGCIADQYRYLKTGEDRSFRKPLLIRKILYTLAIVLFVDAVVSLYAVMIVGAILALSPEAMMVLAVICYLYLLATVAFMYVVIIRYMITQYICLFDIFRSCDPKWSPLFFGLSFVSLIALSVGIFLNRNKDLGMPEKTE